MRKIIYILIISLQFTSCEDVIEVDLKSAQPRLVIDASLNWFKETQGNNQYIRLTLSAPFFDNTVPPANGATVIVTDLNNNTFSFIEEENTGLYINNSFIPVIDGVYNLTITYNNETYTASEKLMPVSTIDYVEQKNKGGFSGDETEIKAYYTDPEGIDNYYFFEFINTTTKVQSLEAYDDEFTDGNQIFAFFSDENLTTGAKIIIKSYGISKQFYEFISLLLQQTNDESGDPFELQPATVRGNCVNQTNPENYPLGYFKASEVSVLNYTIE
tara:strand:- start:8421 stop:9236 length:816 start_codon:yes stop_codon:yes gene_type:complete